jgi:hypothetical protein
MPSHFLNSWNTSGREDNIKVGRLERPYRPKGNKRTIKIQGQSWEGKTDTPTRQCQCIKSTLTATRHSINLRSNHSLTGDDEREIAESKQQTEQRRDKTNVTAASLIPSLALTNHQRSVIATPPTALPLPNKVPLRKTSRWRLEGWWRCRTAVREL